VLGRWGAAVRTTGSLASTELQLLMGVAALWVFFAVERSEDFATFSNAENMARVGAILLVVAVGQTFALVVGGFDISVGANVGFVSVVVALVATEHGGLAAGVLAGLAVGALVGLVNGVIIAGLGVNPFVVTLGMLTFLLGLGNQLSNGGSVAAPTGAYRYFGAAEWGPIPSSLGIAAIVLVFGWVLLARSRFGLYLYAIGGSRDTCRLAGAPVVRYEVLAYTVCGLLAGVAGIILGSRTAVGQSELGAGFELDSIAAAVIGGAAIGGGVGRLSGVVLGAALLTVLQTGMDITGVGEFRQRMVTGAVLVLAVFISQLRAGGLRTVLRTLSWTSRRGALAGRRTT
jgi:ribose transport system permease protein